ncbi:predicted esterase [Longilinea arvoryzae]|uniref:Predicted esterase n=1 Tax=Longilinea arvoryzae TaxID=360412 RepID=A0A0S7BDZ8_9CHLR|nr:alpha/beta hydrolase family protein [Longilinea arvoryzae]GAP13709.1 predicted esterase [Longilinea arvoryzae]
MALIRMDHLAENLKVNLPLYIIVPEPGAMRGIPVRERKVLYLLHGLSDDASAWSRFSTIEILARRYGLVVVMPSVGRSFYIDQPNGQAYFTYLTQELPRYLEDVFGIQPGREKTLIAGLSMGGYGAFKAALLRPERYFAAASFSGVLSMDIWAAHASDQRQTEFELLFGDLNRLPGSEHDPSVWLERAAQNKSVLPRLFAACGRQDDLLPTNLQFKSRCQSLGVALDYHEEDGRHDWPFWDRQIQRFLGMVLEPEE